MIAASSESSSGSDHPAWIQFDIKTGDVRFNGTATNEADVPLTIDLRITFLNDLEATVSKQAETIAHQDERIKDLEAELENQSTNVAGAFVKLSAIDDRLENLEGDSTSPDSETIGESDNDDKNEAETPLETICALEHLAERELTANQERARFLAKDVQDYAEKCPAGLVLDSCAIKRVITAKEGERPHTQTVARVMEFLNRLGRNDVELQKRRGRKLVAIDPDVAERLSTGVETNHDCCDRGGKMDSTESVIGTI